MNRVNVPNFQRPLTTEEMATGPCSKENEKKLKLNLRLPERKSEQETLQRAVWTRLLQRI